MGAQQSGDGQKTKADDILDNVPLSERQSTRLTKDEAKRAWDFFDVDKNGYLDEKEARSWFNFMIDQSIRWELLSKDLDREAYINLLMARMDTSGDGRIVWTEFFDEADDEWRKKSKECAPKVVYTQNVLFIGDTAPNFKADTSKGEIEWHKYIEGKWALLFSHPRDFTPVCTTEVAEVARNKEEWENRGVVTAVLSVDSADDHRKWVATIEEEQKGVDIFFPIIGDEEKRIACLYGMLDKTHVDRKGLPLTVRSVFFIDPDKKIKAIITYPACTGRSFPEILRTLDSLQLCHTFPVATPANWKPGDQVTLTPQVKLEDAQKQFSTIETRSSSCKLRMVEVPSEKKEK